MDSIVITWEPNFFSEMYTPSVIVGLKCPPESSHAKSIITSVISVAVKYSAVGPTTQKAYVIRAVPKNSIKNTPTFLSALYVSIFCLFLFTKLIVALFKNIY